MTGALSYGGASADRKASVLRVHAIHQDIPFTRQTRAGVQAELTALAHWIGLTTIDLA